MCLVLSCVFFFFQQKTAYEMRISDWSSDVCSSDLNAAPGVLRDEVGQAARIPVPPQELRIHGHHAVMGVDPVDLADLLGRPHRRYRKEIGRASCRERVCQYV